MKKKLLLIVNPFSGKKLANKHLVDIISVFSKNNFETLTFITTSRGNATDLAKEYANKVDKVVCIGGDGTFNEVVSGVIQSGTKTPIGYIPSGSTNDFANSLSLSKNFITAAEDIILGYNKKFDIGKFNEKYFSYVASFGAFTKTSYSTPQSVKNSLGHLAYVLEGIKSIPTIKAEHVKISTEDNVFEDDYLFGAISNSTSLGGILTLDKSVVDMNDGVFELILVRKPKSIIELNECVIALRNKTYNDCNMIDFCSTKKVVVETTENVDWTLDGEFYGGKEKIEIENIHDAINLIVNE